jgi:hypothetical protein
MDAAAASSPSASSFDPPSALLRASRASRQQAGASREPRQPQWTGSDHGGGFGGAGSGQSIADERGNIGGSSFSWPGGAAAANAAGRASFGSAAAQSSARGGLGGGSSFSHHSDSAGLMPQPFMAAQAAHSQQTLAQSSWQQPPAVRMPPHAQLSQLARPIAPAVVQAAPAQTLRAPAVGASTGQPSAIGMAPMPQHPASYPLPAYLQSPSAVQRAPGQREAQSSGNAWRG